MPPSPARPLSPSSLPSKLDRDYAAFLVANPTYAETNAIDEVRATEFRRLEDQHLVYLDYTGGGLYPVSVIADHVAFLTTHVLGNPHSVNPASALSGSLIERCRAHILSFFNASASARKSVNFCSSGTLESSLFLSSWSSRSFSLFTFSVTFGFCLFSC